MKINEVQAKQIISVDEAFRYSASNNDTENMRMVLRAHGFDYDICSAVDAIMIGKKFL